MKTLFLDRDGVINPLLEKEVGKISPQSTEEFEFFPKVEEALKLAKENGYRIVVYTNQPDVGKEWRDLNEERLEEINQVLRKNGADRVYTCTHGPLGGKENKYYREGGEIVTCDCRKPQPGMIEEAASDLEIDFTHSYAVGDSESDLEAAMRYEGKQDVNFAGKYKIGSETEVGDRTFDNIYQVIKYILGDKF